MLPHPDTTGMNELVAASFAALRCVGFQHPKKKKRKRTEEGEGPLSPARKQGQGLGGCLSHTHTSTHTHTRTHALQYLTEEHGVEFPAALVWCVILGSSALSPPEVGFGLDSAPTSLSTFSLRWSASGSLLGFELEGTRNTTGPIVNTFPVLSTGR